MTATRRTGPVSGTGSTSTGANQSTTANGSSDIAKALPSVFAVADDGHWPKATFKGTGSSGRARSCHEDFKRQFARGYA